MATFPKEITKKIYVCVHDENIKNKEEIISNAISVYSFDMSEHGYTTIHTQTITVVLPPKIDVSEKILKKLEFKRNEALKTLEEVEDEIKNFTALPAPEQKAFYGDPPF